MAALIKNTQEYSREISTTAPDADAVTSEGDEIVVDLSLYAGGNTASIWTISDIAVTATANAAEAGDSVVRISNRGVAGGAGEAHVDVTILEEAESAVGVGTVATLAAELGKIYLFVPTGGDKDHADIAVAFTATNGSTTMLVDITNFGQRDNQVNYTEQKSGVGSRAVSTALIQSGANGARLYSPPATVAV